MFTGLVDDVGTIERVTATEAGRELLVRCRYDDLALGESIAVDGACLTVRESGATWFTAAAVTTTLERTTVGAWHVGRRVNLERALRASDRLGGHMVQGHVDAVGTVTHVQRDGDAQLVDVQIEPELFQLMVPHGSVAIDGISLTVNALPRDNVVQLSLIEYTLRHSTAADWRPGTRVHVEGDVIGKYVRRFTLPYVSRGSEAVQ